ncbi:hypothetical protein DIPPA_08239 [Diplonema papillatum]|nr:hypothetical protein DIPPA_08239 [Diplonema papillatum]
MRANARRLQQQVALRWPQSDAEAGRYLQAKYTAQTPRSRERMANYGVIRKLRLSFFKDFAGLRRGGVAGIQAYTEALKFFGKLGMPARSQLLLDLAMEDHISPSVSMYLRVLQSNALVGELEGISYILRRTWNLTASADVSARFLTYCIMGLRHAGERYKCFEVAVTTWPIHKGHPAVFTTLLTACRNFEEGSTLFTDMANSGMQLSVADWGSLLDSSVLSGDVESAMHVVRLMREFKVDVTAVQRTMFASSYVHAGDSQGFLEVFKVFEDKKRADDDQLLQMVFLRHAEVARILPEDGKLLQAGGMRAVEVNIGIHGSLADFARAFRAYEKRGLIINSGKTWPAAVVRLVTAGWFAVAVAKGSRAADLHRLTAGPRARFAEEKGGFNEAYLQCLLHLSQANHGHGCVRIWGMLRVFLDAAVDMKRLRVSVYTLRQLCFCFVRRLHAVSAALQAHSRVYNPMSALTGVDRDSAVRVEPCGLEVGELRTRVAELLRSLREVYDYLYAHSPHMASFLVSPMVAAYSALGRVDDACALYRLQLLAGHPAHLLVHAEAFREIFAVRGDTVAISHLDKLQERTDVMRRFAQSFR